MQTQKTTGPPAKTPIAIDLSNAAWRPSNHWTPHAHSGAWQGSAPAHSGTGWAPTPWAQQPSWAPVCTHVDMADEGAQIVCWIDLPGVRAADIELVCTGLTLTVTGTRAPAAGGPGLLHHERGTLHRAVSLPAPVLPGEVQASLGEGVLTIRLPKATPTEAPCRVEIQA